MHFHKKSWPVNEFELLSFHTFTTKWEDEEFHRHVFRNPSTLRCSFYLLQRSFALCNMIHTFSRLPLPLFRYATHQFAAFFFSFHLLVLSWFHALQSTSEDSIVLRAFIYISQLCHAPPTIIISSSYSWIKGKKLSVIQICSYFLFDGYLFMPLSNKIFF